VYKTLKEGRIVYGGGGIMPDIFVPLDTMTYTPFFRAIRRYNLVNDASLKYVDRHRNEIKEAYPDFEQYMEHYEVPTALTDSILAEAKRKKVEAKDSLEAENTLDQLRFTLKALIAYDIWERSEYFRIINTRSDIVKKALEVLAEGRKNKKKICRNKKSL
jgi:carboxyl-terminal processing protease